MADGTLKPASEVPIARQDRGFVVCDEERLAALHEADEAQGPAAEFEAVSVAFHLWQAQQQAVESLMDRAQEETRNGYDVHPFTDWLQGWMDEMNRGLRPLGERNNALVKQLGKRTAEKLGIQRITPRLNEIQARINTAESASGGGLLGDLESVHPHDDLLEPITGSPSEVEIVETEDVSLRPLTAAERSVTDNALAWIFEVADETGGQTAVRPMSNQDLSDALNDQWTRPALVGSMPKGGYCFVFKGRYFVSSSAGGLSKIKAFERLAVEPQNEAEVRAFVEANLPAARSVLERMIAWANDPEDVDTGLADVIEHIELERDIHEGDETEAVRVAEEIRADLQRSHDKGLLTVSELSQCLQALGDEPLRREVIPEHVRHAVWRRDQGRCVQCGSQDRLEFDHIVPFSEEAATPNGISSFSASAATESRAPRSSASGALARQSVRRSEQRIGLGIGRRNRGEQRGSPRMHLVSLRMSSASAALPLPVRTFSIALRTLRSVISDPRQSSWRAAGSSDPAQEPAERCCVVALRWREVPSDELGSALARCCLGWRLGRHR